MRTRACLALLGVLGSVGFATAALADEPDYPATPDEIRAYRDSGEWDRDIATVAKKVKRYIGRRLRARKRPAKPALVLDIDETSLDNYACFERSDFDIASALAPCVVAFDAPAIEQTRSVFRFARKRKVAVFFVTGRPTAIREGTRENLADAGYRGRYRLITRPDDYDEPSVVPYKRGARRKIARDGYRILANVGDQRSDLEGGYSARSYLVPNPMYVAP